MTSERVIDMTSETMIDFVGIPTISDSRKQTLYSKEYRGESRTVADSQWWHIIHHAVDAMVRDMGNDENLTRVLATGKP
jgi:hypothetical protein